ncbi:unnamed protein product [Chrysoparadoxa australica]
MMEMKPFSYDEALPNDFSDDEGDHEELESKMSNQPGSPYISRSRGMGLRALQQAFGDNGCLPWRTAKQWRDKAHYVLGSYSELHRPYTLPLLGSCTLLEFSVLLALVLYAFLYAKCEWGASVISCTMLVLLLPARGSVVSLLTGMGVEKLLRFHRWAGYVLAIPMYLHGMSHHAFRKWTGAHYTGNVAALLYMAMVVLSLPPVRKHFFELFFLSHFPLAVAFTATILWHDDEVLDWICGVACRHSSLPQANVLWRQGLASSKPHSVVFVDAPSAQSACSFTHSFPYYFHPQLVNVTRHPNSTITKLSVAWDAPPFKPGQFAWVRVPTVSQLQWHPFSFSSSPQRNVATFHIRALGGWTEGIHSLISHPNAEIFVDGPYGGPTIPYTKCQELVLVGGGVGVTPLMSIAGDLLEKCQASAGNPCGTLKRVLLIWVVRDQGDLRSFQPQLQQLQGGADANGSSDEGGRGGGCSFGRQIFVTGDISVEERVSCEGVEFARPSLSALLELHCKEAKERGHSTLACISCGPSGMTDELALSASRVNDRESSFSVHFQSESFAM